MSTYDVVMHDERHGDSTLRFRVSRDLRPGVAAGAPIVEVHVGGAWQRVDRVVQVIRMGVAGALSLGCREDVPRADGKPDA